MRPAAAFEGETAGGVDWLDRLRESLTTHPLFGQRFEALGGDLSHYEDERGRTWTLDRKLADSSESGIALFVWGHPAFPSAESLNLRPRRNVYRQAFPALGLSIEQGTENVPDDGRYHLLVHGETMNHFPNEAAALRGYEEARRRLIKETGWVPSSPAPKRDEILARLRAEMDLRAVQADASRSKKAKATKKGGKGGSGGV